MTEQKPLWRRLLAGASRRFLPHSDWGDRMYAHQHSRNAHGRPPAPNTYPVRFNDYLFKMKTDGTLLEPMRQFISDKEYVKTYIGGTVGWEHTVKTLAVLRHPDEVDSLKLEHFPCVLKPTHTSGNVIFITDLEVPLERDLLRSWFTIDYYKQTREQNYRFLRPKIIVEEFFSEDGVTPPKDFKVFCFGGGGVPEIVQVDSDRHIRHTRNLYDIGWNRLPFAFGFPDKPENDAKPAQLDKMLNVAARLAEPFSFVRVDMYTNDSEIKVGELTNCPENAGGRIVPRFGEFVLGEMLERHTTQGHI